jgi:hypothetical protein
MIDIRKANLWRLLPRVSYCNYRKEYGEAVHNCFKSWFSFTRYWGGRLWNISVLHHQITFDFRYSWVDDLAFPWATKKDREIVDTALKDIE